ncbi:hypothetical protein QYE76_040167 [Lolium multiflorum]|uniref:Rad60/SUMO-like domain-containing protein n=1 Tax=Lolium multiflorum TaxID=4521 RepID=A0AAD8TCL3_LOLMU|nr:hypothetical protein QYE76_040167 [Lolium multiflorum]
MSSTSREEDSKAAVPLLVKLKVVGQENVAKHTMRMTDKLQDLMDAWYRKVPETKGTGLFMYDGCRFRADSTPEELGMEEGDSVDFFHHVDGGALVG